MINFTLVALLLYTMKAGGFVAVSMAQWLALTVDELEVPGSAR